MLSALTARLLSAGVVGILCLNTPLTVEADQEPKGYDPDYGFYDQEGRQLDYSSTGSSRDGSANGWHAEEDKPPVYHKDYDGDYEMRKSNGRRYIRDNDYAGEQYRGDPDVFENDLDFIDGEYAYRGYSADDYDYQHYGSDKNAILVPRIQPRPIQIERDEQTARTSDSKLQERRDRDWVSIGLDFDGDGRYEKTYWLHRTDWEQAMRRSQQRQLRR